jgi:pterin-4a-carbinolamine dehydratase
MTKTAETERAEIVAWLRDRPNNSDITQKERQSANFMQMVGFINMLANAIERGDHHKDKSDEG